MHSLWSLTSSLHHKIPWKHPLPSMHCSLKTLHPYLPCLSPQSSYKDHLQALRVTETPAIDRSSIDGDRGWFAMRRLQVPAQEVHVGLHLRALFRLRPVTGPVRCHPQGLWRQQRVQALGAGSGPRSVRGCRHDRLRGSSADQGPCVRLCRPHLCSPAAGDLSVPCILLQLGRVVAKNPTYLSFSRH